MPRDTDPDLARLRTALRQIRHHLPDAAVAHLDTTDQQIGAGFLLSDVTDANGATLRATGWDTLADAVEQHLTEVRWDAVVGEDEHGHAVLAVPPAETGVRCYQVSFTQTVSATVIVDAVSPEAALSAAGAAGGPAPDQWRSARSPRARHRPCPRARAHHPLTRRMTSDATPHSSPVETSARRY